MFSLAGCCFYIDRSCRIWKGIRFSHKSPHYRGYFGMWRDPVSHFYIGSDWCRETPSGFIVLCILVSDRILMSNVDTENKFVCDLTL